jgi:hypothetical protein
MLGLVVEHPGVSRLRIRLCLMCTKGRFSSAKGVRASATNFTCSIDNIEGAGRFLSGLITHNGTVNKGRVLKCLCFPKYKSISLLKPDSQALTGNGWVCKGAKHVERTPLWTSSRKRQHS